MSAPPLLLGAALLFWGWHTQVLAYAIVMTLIVLGARWVPWRFALTDKDFNRITDLSSVGFVLVALYQFQSDSFHAIYPILALLPFIMFGLYAAQVYSTRGGVRLTALFLSVRRAVAKGLAREERSVDLTFPYFTLCLVSASAGALRSDWFYPVSSLLVAGALYGARPARYRAGVCAGMLLVAFGAGFLGYHALAGARSWIQPMVIDWLQDRFRNDRNPFRTHTAIGTIARLKSSDRIVLRVRPDSGPGYPILLRQASYQTFSHNTWLAGVTSFSAVQPGSDGTQWPLHAGTPAPRYVDVSTTLQRGGGLLSVPMGAHRIERLAVRSLSLSPLGALEVGRGPGLVSYRVRYDPGVSYDLAPNAYDLMLPRGYEDLMAGIARDLDLAAMAPRAAMRRLSRYFSEGFSYAVVGGRRGSPVSLAQFLRETRAGHCEYFASATVLALRAAGIPARYATGYSVQEYSALESSFIVRRRHAHSWALAWVDGRWRDLDTTPAVWHEREERSAAWWEPVYDLVAWLGYRFSRWRWGDTGADHDGYLPWVLAALIALLAWRLAAQERVRRAGARQGGEAPGPAPPGMDSDFYRIEQRLCAGGEHRLPGETSAAWIKRLERAAALPGSAASMGRILALHYAYRFDPAGVSASRRGQLRALVIAWLRRHAP